MNLKTYIVLNDFLTKVLICNVQQLFFFIIKVIIQL